MTALFAASASLVLRQAFIAKLATARLGRLFLIVAGGPIRAIPAPVPCVFTFSLTIGHSLPPCRETTLPYQRFPRVATHKYPRVISIQTPIAAGFSAWWSDAENNPACSGIPFRRVHPSGSLPECGNCGSAARVEDDRGFLRGPGFNHPRPATG